MYMYIYIYIYRVYIYIYIACIIYNEYVDATNPEALKNEVKFWTEGLEMQANQCMSRESIEVRESTRVVLGDIKKRGWCGVLSTLVSCCPRSLRDPPP